MTDFGCATYLCKGGFLQGIIGTPEYMAPELTEGGYYSHSVDWFSLGKALKNIYRIVRTIQKSRGLECFKDEVLEDLVYEVIFINLDEQKPI